MTATTGTRTGAPTGALVTPAPVWAAPTTAPVLLRFYYSPLDEWCSVRWVEAGEVRRYSGPLDGLPLNLSTL